MMVVMPASLGCCLFPIGPQGWWPSPLMYKLQWPGAVGAVCLQQALWTFLKCQAGSAAHLHVRTLPELVAVSRLLMEKEQRLWETEPLMHNEKKDLRKLAENEVALCQKEIS